jgi:hypothetical protein
MKQEAVQNKMTLVTSPRNQGILSHFRTGEVNRPPSLQPGFYGCGASLADF